MAEIEQVTNNERTMTSRIMALYSDMEFALRIKFERMAKDGNTNEEKNKILDAMDEALRDLDEMCYNTIIFAGMIDK